MKIDQRAQVSPSLDHIALCNAQTKTNLKKLKKLKRFFLISLNIYQGCRPRGCPQIMADQLTKEGRLCPPNNTGTPGFPDLPTALLITQSQPFLVPLYNHPLHYRWLNLRKFFTLAPVSQKMCQGTT